MPKVTRIIGLILWVPFALLWWALILWLEDDERWPK
jgi:hypothetical protein